MSGNIETVEQLCAEMRSFGDVPPPRLAWRDLADRAEAAHKHEIAAKDAEIEPWRKQALQEDVRANVVLSRLHKAEALIATLGDALEKACVGDPVMRSYFGSLIDDAKAYEAGKDSAAK